MLPYGCINWWRIIMSRHCSMSVKKAIVTLIITLLVAGFYIGSFNENLFSRISESGRILNATWKQFKYAVDIPKEIIENESQEYTGKQFEHAVNIPKEVIENESQEYTGKQFEHAVNIPKEVIENEYQEYRGKQFEHAVNIPKELIENEYQEHTSKQFKNTVNLPKELIKNGYQEYIGKQFKYAVNIPKEVIENESQEYVNERKCPQLPAQSDITLVNDYWQQFKPKNGVPIYLYSAHYDKRKILNGDAFIRIFSMMNALESNKEHLCVIWYLSKGKINTVSTPVTFQSIRRVATTLNTYMLNCNIPNSHIKKIPFAVSITKLECEKVSNILHVNYEKVNDAKNNIGVCIKGLGFQNNDKSIYLIEWLELQKIFGVDKVSMYEMNVHQNMSRVLKHYRDEGFVDILPFSLPGSNANESIYSKNTKTSHLAIGASEKIAYNDCFYRNMNKYKYIAILDLDEIIVSMKFNIWNDLLEDLENKYSGNKKTPAGYQFERYHNLDSFQNSHGYNADIPEYMKILQNVYRTVQSGDIGKSIVSTELVYTLGNHIPLLCFGDGGTGKQPNNAGCFVPNVPKNEAYGLHYRAANCDRKILCEGNKAVKDTITWKYKDSLIKQTNEKLKLLKLI